MTEPGTIPTAEPERGARLVRAAIWVAIGALIAAAIVSVVWVLVGTQNGIVGRAFLTILLLAAFAGAAILDAHLAPRRPAWFALVSMAGWVVALLVGAFLVWMPERTYGDPYSLSGFNGVSRFMSFLLIVLIIQLAILHVRLYTKAIERVPSTFNRIVGYITIALVVILAFMLILPLTLHEWVRFYEIYWRLVVAATILAAVGTALVPLVNLLFAPRRPRAAGGESPPAAQAWPTYADGVTPLPVLQDGSPDWNAYYTGYPTGYVHPAAPATSPTADAAYAPHPPAAGGEPRITPSEPPVAPPAVQPPAQPPAGYEGYPPPPPLPPR